LAASAVREIVDRELAKPVDPRVTEMAAAIAARYPSAAAAVLFYGSCLRQSVLEGLMLDFYVIVSSYREAYGRGWLAFANRLIPPNVFPFEHQGLVAKYAVLSEADLVRECGIHARSVSVWARFAQPARLVWAKDGAARGQTVASVAEAAPTLFALTIPTMDWGRDDPVAVFRAGFALTYGAELRAEKVDRSTDIVAADRDYYRRLGQAVLATCSWPAPAPGSAARGWRWRRRKGKALTLVRLAKSSTTFAGGIDYLAWKINRHAGTAIEIRPWQRKWPFIAALILLPRLLKRGAIR
jgi:hypothetical protein